MSNAEARESAWRELRIVMAEFDARVRLDSRDAATHRLRLALQDYDAARDAR